MSDVFLIYHGIGLSNRKFQTVDSHVKRKIPRELTLFQPMNSDGNSQISCIESKWAFLGQALFTRLMVRKLIKERKAGTGKNWKITAITEKISSANPDPTPGEAALAFLYARVSGESSERSVSSWGANPPGRERSRQCGMNCQAPLVREEYNQYRRISRTPIRDHTGTTPGSEASPRPRPTPRA